MATRLSLLPMLLLLLACLLARPGASSDSGMCTAPPAGETATPSCSGGDDAAAVPQAEAEEEGEEPENGWPFVIDITATITKDTPVWDSPDGLGVFYRMLHHDMARGHNDYVSYVGINSHAGTHINMPAAFSQKRYNKGKRAEELDLKRLTGPVLVFPVPPGKNLTKDFIISLNIPAGTSRIIFKTDSTDKGLMKGPVFDSSFTALTPEGAHYLLDFYPLDLLGIDYLSLATYDTFEKTSKELVKKDVIMIEGLDLSDVEPGWYTLTCLPLKLGGVVEAAPARCVLTNAPVEYYRSWEEIQAYVRCMDGGECTHGFQKM